MALNCACVSCTLFRNSVEPRAASIDLLSHVADLQTHQGPLSEFRHRLDSHCFMEPVVLWTDSPNHPEVISYSFVCTGCELRLNSTEGDGSCCWMLRTSAPSVSLECGVCTQLRAIGRLRRHSGNLNERLWNLFTDVISHIHTLNLRNEQPEGRRVRQRR